MQQLAATFFASIRLPRLACLALGFVLVACHKEEARTYVAPKQTRETTAPLATTGASSTSLTPVSWSAPASWQEQPASGMRVASFTVAKDGQHADVSIIPLGGGSGGELANVNRWRGQVGLEPLDEVKLATSGEPIAIGTQSASLYDLAGSDPQTKQPARILAASLSSGGTTWFFKMTGSDTLVAEEKPDFKVFLQSVKFQAGAGTDPVAQTSLPAMPAMPALPAMNGGGAAPGGEKPTWDVPAGWQEQPPTSMRVGSFKITGEGGAKADLSVVKLAGTAGGNLANVNRWRAQLGLEPVDQAGFDKLVTTLDLGGAKVLVVDMAGRSVEAGDQARLLAAIVPRAGSMWFYKLVGNDQLVSAQKAAFLRFVESARYPNVS